MTNTVSTYLKYAILQMASESRLDLFANQLSVAGLEFGNGRSNRFPTVLTQQLIADGWVVVDHKANSPTGFSGTLFRYDGQSDAARGLVSGELVMSFRSTEFADDAARDAEATGKKEISEHGWAFGQIDDMRQWYQSLSIPADANLTVTGYSLGGHLATAFNLLYPGAADATYAFNGAGVGEWASGTLAQTIDTFHSIRTSGAPSLFITTEGQELYQQYNTWANTTPTTDALTSAIAYLSTLDTSGSAQYEAEVALLASAMKRALAVRIEVDRVNAGIPNTGTGGAAKPVDASLVEALRLDYQLAVSSAGNNTSAYRTGLLQIADDARANVRHQKPALPNFYDVHGSTFPSVVAISQWHYGAATPIFIEDQPLVRGFAEYTVTWQSIMYSGLKLLGPNFSTNDFGDTHSLVLLVDSLSVQDALASLDPSVTVDMLNAVLRGASNATKTTLPPTQGKAEGDVLERVVDSLYRMFKDPTAAGLNTATLLEGGTWAEIEPRNLLHAKLRDVVESPAFMAVQGHVSLDVKPSGAALAALVPEDFGALVAVMSPT